MAFTMQALADWLNTVSTVIPVPFTVGPEIEEFGDADNAATVTRVPGGLGEVRERTFERFSVLVVMRTRRELHADLEKAFEQIDTALGNVTCETLWGTYVLTARRQGTVDADFEEPERNSLIANYAIEIGK